MGGAGVEGGEGAAAGGHGFLFLFQCRHCTAACTLSSASSVVDLGAVLRGDEGGSCSGSLKIGHRRRGFCREALGDQLLTFK